ncbi:hypothetical protein [Streptomyces flavidovirens]
MPLPVGLSTVTVTGTYKHPDGTPFKGKLLFTPEPAILTSAAHGTLILGTLEVPLDVNGAVSVPLLATDDADVTPSGWTYRVTERWYGAPGRSYPLSLPAAAPAVDLADVAPTAPAAGVYVVVTGPQGPPGADGSEAEAEAYTDAAVANHSAAVDPHGDRSWASSIFATITALDTTNGNVFTLNGFLDDIFARLAAIEQGTAFLTAVNTSHVNVASKHTLDGTNDKLGFHGAAPITKQTVTGSWADGSAGASLANALANLGLIVDNTTA